MRRTFYQRHRRTIERTNGLFFANPVLERGLVLAPVVVASYNCVNSLILGISFFCITFFTVLVSSFIPKKIPYTIRTTLYTLIACAFFVPTAIWMEQMFPQTVFRIGVFLPLLAANSLIVVKSESRFHKHRLGRMIVDLFCHCLGFFWVILLVGGIRELVGSGTLFGFPIQGAFTVPAALMPFSGFILVGLLAAAVRRIKFSLEHPAQRRKPIAPADLETEGGSRS